MSELRAIRTLWQREVKKFLREKPRLLNAFCQPLLWLFIFGTGLRFSPAMAGYNYQEFIFPGLVCQAMLFTAMFMGVSVIWDREFGFLKEILVSPVRRPCIFLGKMFGISTDVMLQGLIIIPFGLLIGVQLDPGMVLQALPIMLLITFGLVCIGLSFASLMKSFEGFGLIQTFINLPMFFLSGALFPLSNVPAWLRTVSYANPLTYGVDALRTVMMGDAWTPLFPMHVSIGVLLFFDIVMFSFGTYAFGRTE
ncbi:daunorubicin ABC transporter permease [Methanoculleus sp. FWC-SCC1]|uniref:Daunorubicin ABC transporter permease n=1 Tax=Methanoculleus frigidifontis TaxID=2584085 RepID=A0ABT8M8X9_9EURY|nr:ABC transporter permease [Methanoculleus sp. FWC-SCC1]MDN7024378.1 daunorubicin ABC transporter permease [Methanoculleus sp. FWC-SCC1]